MASAQVVTDRDTGRSRGFGFVEFDSDDEGNAAIASLNSKGHEWPKPSRQRGSPTRRIASAAPAVMSGGLVRRARWL